MVYFKFLEPAIFQLSKEYDKREKAIKSCVGVLSQKVNALRKEREENMDDFDLMRKLRKEQTKVNIFMNSNFNSYGMRTDFYIICCNGLGCFLHPLSRKEQSISISILINWVDPEYASTTFITLELSPLIQNSLMLPSSYLLLKERAWGVDHHKLLFKG